jgi:hypothetical protein
MTEAYHSPINHASQAPPRNYYQNRCLNSQYRIMYVPFFFFSINKIYLSQQRLQTQMNNHCIKKELHIVIRK